MIFVVENVRKPIEADCHFYCGRNSSYKESYGINMDLGNPFIMLTEGMRDPIYRRFEELFELKKGLFIPKLRVIYRKYLDIEQIKPNPVIALGCFCAPKKCHCDVYVEFLNSFIK